MNFPSQFFKSNQAEARRATANAVSRKSKKKKFIDVKIHRKLITRAMLAKSILQLNTDERVNMI